MVIQPGEEKRRLQGDPVGNCQYSKGACRKDGADFIAGPIATEQGVVILKRMI